MKKRLAIAKGKEKIKLLKILEAYGQIMRIQL